MNDYQLFPALDRATEAALRYSIEKWGVLVPVVKDQHGNVLDGYHRSRIASDLGVDYRVDVIVVENEQEARQLARTLNTDRRQLSIEQRREMVQAMREEGHSLRAIAGAVGVDDKTVRNDLSTTADMSAVPERITGRDGKSRPAKRTLVAAKSQKEADRAQHALTQIDTTPATVLDVKRVERLAREGAAARRSAEPLRQSPGGDVSVEHGPFHSALAGYDLTRSVVISDPPYPREFLPEWERLAAWGLDRGVERMVLMAGQTILPDVLRMFDGWHYRWCCAYIAKGAHTRVWNAGIATMWKPILVFDRGGDRPFVTQDVFVSSGDDKRFHHWGQNEHGFAQLVEAFSTHDDLVVDPFLGGGTTAIVCRSLGRRFVGADIDKAAVNATLERLAA